MARPIDSEAEPLVLVRPDSSPVRRPCGGRVLIGLPVLLLLLSACGSVPAGASAVRSPAATNTPTRKEQSPTTQGAEPKVSPAGSPAPSAAPSPSVKVKLEVRIELEPNDYLHRNYCVEGAIAVLLSTWTTAPPSIDAIGVAAHVVESYGTTGINAVQAINSYLEQITGSSRYAYSGTHVTSLAVFRTELEADLSGLGRFAIAKHGSPVLVHVMTATLPGWDGYQAQHMIAVFGYNFTAGTLSGDTVTYVESAGSVA
ncbi:MAG TPA: hypothetical protein VMV23_03325, partial [Candidatus Nanopelagicaceae bacterium]|nr:hypothetical protein [Candidatus Nanopelagicaceae bacterium]